MRGPRPQASHGKEGRGNGLTAKNAGDAEFRGAGPVAQHGSALSASLRSTPSDTSNVAGNSSEVQGSWSRRMEAQGGRSDPS